MQDKIETLERHIKKLNEEAERIEKNPHYVATSLLYNSYEHGLVKRYAEIQLAIKDIEQRIEKTKCENL